MEGRIVTRHYADRLQQENEEKTSIEAKLEKIASNKRWIAEQYKATISQFREAQEFFGLLVSADRQMLQPPEIKFDGEYIYQQKTVWQKTMLADFQKEQPRWRTVRNLEDVPDKESLDKIIFDEEDRYLENFSYSFDYSPDKTRAVVTFCLPETDIKIMREYDVSTKKLVKQGFQLPASECSQIEWFDNDSVLVKSHNKKAGPKIKLWRRGELFKDATIIFTGQKTDYGFSLWVFTVNNHQYNIIQRYLTRDEVEIFIIQPDKTITKIPVPLFAKLEGFLNGHFIFSLKKDWDEQKFKAGSIFSLYGLNYTSISLVFSPTPNAIFKSLTIHDDDNCLVLITLNNVSAEAYRLHLNNNTWVSKPIPLPDKGDLTVIGAANGHCLIAYESFTVKQELFHYDGKANEVRLIKSTKMPSDNDMITTQFFAKSKDGTQIPYFVVHHKDVNYDGNNGTLLTGYGGFRRTQMPTYLRGCPRRWIENKGVYVLANIRGGLEFGPNWHDSVVKENHYKVFEDFIAVAEDLIRRKITSAKHLGIMGGSNGGLLVTMVAMLRPDLFNAVIANSPLTNMLTYDLLFNETSSSWMNEYGDPNDPSLRPTIKQFSPYHHVSKYKNYPKILFATANDDTVVHPGHVRTMVEKMQSLGHQVFYYESKKGGHCFGKNYDEYFKAEALFFSYLKQHLIDNKCSYSHNRLFPPHAGVKRKAKCAELEPEARKKDKINCYK